VNNLKIYLTLLVGAALSVTALHLLNQVISFPTFTIAIPSQPPSAKWIVPIDQSTDLSHCDSLYLDIGLDRTGTLDFALLSSAGDPPLQQQIKLSVGRRSVAFPLSHYSAEERLRLSAFELKLTPLEGDGTIVLYEGSAAAADWRALPSKMVIALLLTLFSFVSFVVALVMIRRKNRVAEIWRRRTVQR
jgi:disulfide bond formation protein DsbB